MSLILSKPNYPCDPITQIEALARALRTPEAELREICTLANRSYSRVAPPPNSTREIFNARPRLKKIHLRIKEVIFHKVVFPLYLTGSIKGCDYVTNAALHTNKRILICEDVTKFFPSVKEEKVYDVWRNLFLFSGEVAEMLTRLTTRYGSLPQGAITSSYLANLVLWRDEPFLQAKMQAHGITYSRYVDDMALSSKRNLSTEEQRAIIADVYGMLRKNGLSAQRKKHEVFDSSERMIVTKLIVNRKPSLNNKKLAALRTQVYRLEQAANTGASPLAVMQFAEQTSNKAGQVGRFHKVAALKSRIRLVKDNIQQAGGVTYTTGPQHAVPQPAGLLAEPSVPWE